MATRTIGTLIAGLALVGCGPVTEAEAEPEGIEMSVFRVPSRHGLAPTALDRELELSDAEGPSAVLMPPDVVARPGEEPDQALDRALADGRTRPEGREEP